MSNEIVKVEQSNQVEVLNFFNQSQFETMQRVAMVFVNSDIVPERYRISANNPKEKAIGNTLIALEMASRIGASPLMVMQNLYIVHGTPGWSAKFLIATANTCGKYEEMQYKMTLLGKIKFGNVELENWECIAFTKRKGSDVVLESSPVDVAMAIAEGWYGKNGSKWKTMPKKMLRYRAASFWINEFDPALSMGMKTADEIEDISYEEIKVDVADKVKTEVKNNANKDVIGFDTPPAETKPEGKPADNPPAEKQDETKPETKEEEGPGY